MSNQQELLGRVVGYSAAYGLDLIGTRWGMVLEVVHVGPRLLVTVRNIHTGTLDVANGDIIHTVMPKAYSALMV